MRPQYLTRDEVPADVVEHEREIAEATSREEGKPEQAIAKITEGRLNGFFKDVVLLEQPSVTENKKSVKAVLDESGTTVKRLRPFRGRRLNPVGCGLVATADDRRSLTGRPVANDSHEHPQPAFFRLRTGPREGAAL